MQKSAMVCQAQALLRSHQHAHGHVQALVQRLHMHIRSELRTPGLAEDRAGTELELW